MSEIEGRAKGGFARAEKLSPQEKVAIARKAALARWQKNDEKILVAEYEGELELSDEVKLECYVLSDKRRVFNKRAMAKAIGLKSDGGNVFMRTMNSKGIGSLIPQKVRDALNNPIMFKPLQGDLAHGYEGALLVEICDAIWEARKQGKLSSSQELIGLQAEILLRSAAKVGIIALIDEAAGYKDRTKEEYREYFRECIREDVREWEKEFPEQFFDVIYELYKIRRTHKNKHPRFFAQFIRKYVYKPLINSNGAILEMLEEKNPVIYASGGRKFKLHQFLTEEVGLPALKSHLWQLIGIGNATGTKASFEKAFARAFPQIGDQRKLFDDDDLWS